MKTSSTKVITITCNIDYENGFGCEYTIVNGKFIFGHFYNELYKYLCYVDEKTLNKLKNNHWSDHHKLYKEPKITKQWLENFNEFDKLIYIGGGRDGMLAYSDGTFISTPIKFDDIFFQCWEHIETTKEECEKILKSMNSNFITSSNIIEIPYYNQSGDAKDHYTLTITVKLPDDIYLNILNSKKYIDEICKQRIIKFLKQ
jgi:uncharacterized protein YxeA